jgi:hypothetical protein
MFEVLDVFAKLREHHFMKFWKNTFYLYFWRLNTLNGYANL